MGERDNTDVLLRAAAVEVDQAEWQQLDLANVWRELVDGESRVVDNFHTEERCYVVLAPIAEGSDPGRIARGQAGKIRILESILLESAQKNVAIDLGLSPSTVASTLKQCLEQLGLLCTTSRISPLLVAAAHAFQVDSQRRWGRVSRLPIQGLSLRVISVDRPEAELARVLTPAQYDVIRLLVEGKSHHEIALSRHRSTRTIANQLGAAFRKLGVSGRSELLRRLIMQPSALGRVPSPPAPPSPPALSLARRSWDEAPITVRRYRPRVRRVGVRASA